MLPTISLSRPGLCRDKEVQRWSQCFGNKTTFPSCLYPKMSNWYLNLDSYSSLRKLRVSVIIWPIYQSITSPFPSDMSTLYFYLCLFLSVSLAVCYCLWVYRRVSIDCDYVLIWKQGLAEQGTKPGEAQTHATSLYLYFFHSVCLSLSLDLYCPFTGTPLKSFSGQKGLGPGWDDCCWSVKINPLNPLSRFLFLFTIWKQNIPKWSILDDHPVFSLFGSTYSCYCWY